MQMHYLRDFGLGWGAQCMHFFRPSRGAWTPKSTMRSRLMRVALCSHMYDILPKSCGLVFSVLVLFLLACRATHMPPVSHPCRLAGCLLF